MSIQAKLKAFPLLERYDMQNAFGQIEQIWRSAGEINGTFVLDEIIRSDGMPQSIESRALFLTQERGQVAPGLNRIKVDGRVYDVVSVFITERYSKVKLKAVEEAGNHVGS